MNGVPGKTSIPRQCPIYSLYSDSDRHYLKNTQAKFQYGLSTKAATIWELCSGQFSVGDIIDILKTSFPLAATSIRKDVFSILSDLHKRKMLYYLDLDGSDATLATEFPDGRKICADPTVAVFEDFLSEDECAQFIKHAKPRLERATVAENGQRIVSGYRTNDLAQLKDTAASFQNPIKERAAKLIGLPAENCEELQVLHYEVGEEYKIHSDTFDMALDSGRAFTLQGGQRVATFLIYLNTVTAGGETSFPEIDASVSPVRGRAVLFHNCFPGTVIRDPRNDHQAMPVLEGEKWALPLWFREHPVENTGDAN
jgi:prolyl 4-hydroxylase